LAAAPEGVELSTLLQLRYCAVDALKVERSDRHAGSEAPQLAFEIGSADTRFRHPGLNQQQNAELDIVEPAAPGRVRKDEIRIAEQERRIDSRSYPNRIPTVFITVKTSVPPTVRRRSR